MAKKKNLPESFSIKAGRKEIPCSIEITKKDGSVETMNCRLIEMDGNLRAAWLTFAKGRETVENGMGYVTDFKDYNATLISKNLFNTESGKYVDVATINSKMSQSAMMDLYRACLRLNDFAVPGEDEEGRCPHCLKRATLYEYIKCAEDMEGEDSEGKEPQKESETTES